MSTTMTTMMTVVATIMCFSCLAVADLDDLTKFMDAVEDMVQEFAVEVEEAYRQRCNRTVLDGCERSQFSSCNSALSDRECPSAETGPQLRVPACGDGQVCNAFVDFETSAVRIPATEGDNRNSTPDNPMIIETVCFGQEYDDEMRARFDGTSNLFENTTGVTEAPFLYFGASDGVFRIYPARPSESCDYDPRMRPWYAAASSTPKVVVIVLDVAGYPKTGDFKHVQDTAKAFLSTMTGADRVGVVIMSDTPEVADSGGNEENMLTEATIRVLTRLRRAISRQRETTAPNMSRAFNLTFDLIDNTIEANVVDCHVAVVLLTNGNSLGRIPEDLILERKREVESLSGKTMLFFGYSTETSLDNQDLLSLECNLGAVWSVIDSSTAGVDIVQNVRLFHEAFAFDLGRSIRTEALQLTGLARWSEPYNFFTSDLPGTTIASPVFDRTTSPPMFIGVVGIDMTLEALEDALSPDKVSSIRKQIISRQQRQCGSSFTPCDLEALRLRSRGFHYSSEDVSASVCFEEGNVVCNASDIPILDRAACPPETTLPSILWDNLEGASVDYLERACCAVETPAEKESGDDIEVQCPNDFPTEPLSGSPIIPSSLPPSSGPSSSPLPSPPLSSSPTSSTKTENTPLPTTDAPVIAPTTVAPTETPAEAITSSPTEGAEDGGGRNTGRIVAGLVAAFLVVVVVLVWKGIIPICKNRGGHDRKTGMSATSDDARLEL